MSFREFMKLSKDQLSILYYTKLAKICFTGAIIPTGLVISEKLFIVLGQ